MVLRLVDPGGWHIGVGAGGSLQVFRSKLVQD
jgi:hypothetical protein